jgi:hypothetical protein
LKEATGNQVEVDATPQKLLEYMKSLDLAMGTKILSGNPSISNGRLHLQDMSASTGIGNATFSMDLVPTANGLVVDEKSLKLNLPMQAMFFKGAVTEYMKNLNIHIANFVNTKIDPQWETTSLSLAEDKIRFNFRKKT